MPYKKVKRIKRNPIEDLIKRYENKLTEVEDAPYDFGSMLNHFKTVRIYQHILLDLASLQMDLIYLQIGENAHK